MKMQENFTKQQEELKEIIHVPKDDWLNWTSVLPIETFVSSGKTESFWLVQILPSLDKLISFSVLLVSLTLNITYS